MQVEPIPVGRLDVGVAHIVPVANPRHRFTFNRAAAFVIGLHIGKELTGMMLVSQTIDDWDLGAGCKTHDPLMLEGTNQEDIDHP
jgi:hypothetical protein